MWICIPLKEQWDLYSGPAEAKFNWSGRVRLRAKAWGGEWLCSSRKIFFKFDDLRSLLRSFPPSWGLSVAPGRLDSDSIGDVHVTTSMVWFEHRAYFCTNTKLDPDSLYACIKRLGRGLHEIVAANAALGTVMSFRNSHSRASNERYSQTSGYISLALSDTLLADDKHAYPACTSMWPLEKFWKVWNWSGHGLSNRTRRSY